jgi:hypothetical protein
MCCIRRKQWKISLKIAENSARTDNIFVTADMSVFSGGGKSRHILIVMTQGLLYLSHF